MKFKESFKGIVREAKEGKRLDIIHKPYFFTKINELEVGDQVTVVVSNDKEKRTDAQNRLYWMYLANIAKTYGDEGDTDWLHYNFSHEFGIKKTVIDEKDGVKYDKRIPISTTVYTTDEFSYYLYKIEEATGVPIPDTERYLLGNLLEVMESVKGKYADEMLQAIN